MQMIDNVLDNANVTLDHLGLSTKQNNRSNINNTNLDDIRRVVR